MNKDQNAVSEIHGNVAQVPFFTMNSDKAHGIEKPEALVAEEDSPFRLPKAKVPMDFAQRLLETIPFIDPDSARFIEMTWAERMAKGLNTYYDTFDVPSTAFITLDDITKDVIHHFKGYYKSRNFFRGLRIDRENDVPDMYFVTGVNNNQFVIVAVGEEEEIKEIMDTYRSRWVEPESITVRHLVGFSADGSPQMSATTMMEEDSDLAMDAFYPLIEDGVEELIRGFVTSKKNGMLFIGPPGTGKSTLLRTMLFRCGRKDIFTVTSDQAIMHPSFNGWLNSLPRNSFLAIEDADNLVASRDKARNPQMSNLLSFLDGIVSSNIKVVISTNLENTLKVDSALLRPGRNYRTVAFSHLSQEEANLAREEIDLPEIDFDESLGNLTLAEALNFESTEITLEQRQNEAGFAV